MSLNVIDISSYQADLSLETVFEKNPSLGGVIVKATEGTGYVNHCCDPWVQWLIKHNKPWGFYHYLSGTKDSGAEEAEYFYKHCLNYFGHGIAVADFEAQAVSRGPIYIKQFLDRLYELSGVKAMFYASLSVIQSNKSGFEAIVANGHKLWLAQYASNNVVYGFKETPWQNGSVSPWPRITMHQYTGNGRLEGYSQPLDLDIFYGTVSDWNNIAKKVSVIPTPTPQPDPEPTPTPAPTPKDNNVQAAIELLETALQLLRTHEDG